MSSTSLKQGDTFRLSGVVSRNGSATDITGWSIDSHLVWRNKTYFSLTTSITDAAAGAFTISATASETADWVVGEANCDVRFSETADGTRTTETFTIEIIEMVTDLSRA